MTKEFDAQQITRAYVKSDVIEVQNNLINLNPNVDRYLCKDLLKPLSKFVRIVKNCYLEEIK